ncbi:protoporphyrinogen oxidase [Gordonia shandongensis]|uniref:protoporphyrinogen oxidase n=1 Tax=Gordonia shandongensis TaxID=376351 RepID=UPI00042629D5|nr:protoporphyrinogen oxidase [Gordonia shandongensis]
MNRAPRIAVVGAGITGLTAAYRLRSTLGPAAEITVLDAADRAGGTLRTRTVGGTSVDVGAEAFIVRRPEAVGLIADLGLAAQVVSPGEMRPAIWSAGRLHRLPSPALMGIPTTPDAAAALVSAADRERMSTEARRPLRWAVGADPSVGDLVGERFGPSVVARSVDPMLGGVYSAAARDLGVREAIPALAARLDAGADSLTAAAAAVLDAGAGTTGPVFGALRGGYRELVEALVGAGAAELRLGCGVTGIDRRVTSGGDVTFDVEAAGGGIRVDAVIVAVPPWAAAPLVADAAPPAAARLAAVDAAGSAVVALAVPADARLPEHSGVLVATDAGLSLKAITLSSQKWPHLRAGPVRTLRTSFGRLGAPVTDTDEELVAHAADDLATVADGAGLPAPEIVDAVVQRWPNGLPHYAPGHLSRIGEVRRSLPRGLAVAGAAYGGVGVPACIASAEAAVGDITRALAS